METLLEKLNYQPNGLTTEEIKHPAEAIAYFFGNHPLHVTRGTIWQFYQSWICENAAIVDADKQKEMVFFFNSLIDLVNASYVVSYQKREDVLIL